MVTFGEWSNPKNDLSELIMYSPHEVLKKLTVLVEMGFVNVNQLDFQTQSVGLLSLVFVGDHQDEEK